MYTAAPDVTVCIMQLSLYKIIYLKYVTYVYK